MFPKVVQPFAQGSDTSRAHATASVPRRSSLPKTPRLVLKRMLADKNTTSPLQVPGRKRRPRTGYVAEGVEPRAIEELTLQLPREQWEMVRWRQLWARWAKEPGASLPAIVFLHLPEQIPEWHLEGHGRGYQRGHRDVCGSLLHLDDVLRVDTDGFGRQLQMAVIANNLGECYNPTQAGSSNDGLSSGTTSILDGTYSEPSRLAFQTRPAFWLAAGQAHPFPSPNCTRAINTTNVSNYVMNTDIRVGFMGIRHAIEFNMAVQVPESINAFQLEGPTGYLSGEFSSFHAMDFATGTLVPLSQANEELTRPVVLSVPDGSAAMGVWSPELPGPNASQYAKFAFIDSGNPANSTTKWSAVFRRGALAPGGYGFRSFIFVGTRENVRVAMLQVRNLFLTGQAH